MNSNKITATEGRLNTILNNITNKAIDNNVPERINKAVNNEKIRTGIITKFYPYIDKAEVKLDNNNKKILCKILHRYGGDIMDFFTPLEDSKGYDTKVGEPYIIPRAEQHVCVLSIHDADSKENLILGYYQNEEIIEYNPASPGNIKLMCMSEDNQFWIKFGRDGFDYRLISSPTMTIGDDQENMEEVSYYSKTEVDEKLSYNNGVLDF